MNYSYVIILALLLGGQSAVAEQSNILLAGNADWSPCSEVNSLDDKRNAAEQESYYHKKELQAHDDEFKELGKSATKDDLAKYKAVRARLAKNYEEAERKFKVAKAELAAEKAKCEAEKAKFKKGGSAPQKWKRD